MAIYLLWPPILVHSPPVNGIALSAKMRRKSKKKNNPTKQTNKNSVNNPSSMQANKNNVRCRILRLRDTCSLGVPLMVSLQTLAVNRDTADSVKRKAKKKKQNKNRTNPNPPYLEVDGLNEVTA